MYEIAVAPEAYPREERDVNIDKRNDISNSNPNDNFGSEHAHWHPGTEEGRVIEAKAGKDLRFSSSSTVSVAAPSTMSPAPVSPLHRRDGLSPSYAIGICVLVTLTAILGIVCCAYRNKSTFPVGSFESQNGLGT